MIVPSLDTFRTRSFKKSAMKIFPDASTATPVGLLNEAEVAGPPSPEKPSPEKMVVPLPATVVIIPMVDTFRIRLLKRSAMKRFPEESIVTPVGEFNDADVADPPSPEKPLFPLPATVVIMPLAETFRIRLLRPSAMNRFPEASAATP
jgi:hypothetical protein